MISESEISFPGSNLAAFSLSICSFSLILKLSILCLRDIFCCWEISFIRTGKIVFR